MTTFETIRDIFHSGSHSFTGEIAPITEITFLVEKNYLALSTQVIASKKEYRLKLDDITRNPGLHEIAAGGGSAHVALKKLGSRYLLSRGQTSLYEHPFCGYYPDVLSENKKIVIECGHTQNAAKMLDYFRLGSIKECIQIPYPSIDDDTIVGVSFIRQPDLQEFLCFLEKRRLGNLKRALTRRKML